MIELVVAMTLTVFAGTLAVMLIFSGGKEANRALGNRITAGAAKQTFNALSADVLAAASPDKRQFADFDELGDALAQAPTADIDVFDIRVAGARHLQLRADVVASTGTECIEYVDDDGMFVRLVRSGTGESWRTCTGSVLTRQPLSATVDAPIFSYVALQANAAGECDRVPHASFGDADPAMNRIIQVNADLRSISQRKDVGAETNLVGSFAVHNRGTRTYAEALGCGG